VVLGDENVNPAVARQAGRAVAGIEVDGAVEVAGHINVAGRIGGHSPAVVVAAGRTEAQGRNRKLAVGVSRDSSDSSSGRNAFRLAESRKSFVRRIVAATIGEKGTENMRSPEE